MRKIRLITLFFLSPFYVSYSGDLCPTLKEICIARLAQEETVWYNLYQKGLELLPGNLAKQLVYAKYPLCSLLKPDPDYLSTREKFHNLPIIPIKKVEDASLELIPSTWLSETTWLLNVKKKYVGFPDVRVIDITRYKNDIYISFNSCGNRLLISLVSSDIREFTLDDLDNDDKRIYFSAVPELYDRNDSTISGLAFAPYNAHHLYSSTYPGDAIYCHDLKNKGTIIKRIQLNPMGDVRCMKIDTFGNFLSPSIITVSNTKKIYCTPLDSPTQPADYLDMKDRDSGASTKKNWYIAKNEDNPKNLLFILDSVQPMRIDLKPLENDMLRIQNK